MPIMGIIEKAEVNSVPIMFGALGLVVLVISAQGYTGGIGFRGIAFLKYGKRIWQFSNRLFGGLLVGISLLLYLLFRLSDISAENKVFIATSVVLLCALVSDIITLFLKRRRMVITEVDKKRKST